MIPNTISVMNEGECPPRKHPNLTIGSQTLCQPQALDNILILKKIANDGRFRMEETQW